MTLAPFQQLQKISSALTAQKDFSFCICGGLASSIYRKNPRLTDDLDIAIYLSPEIAKDTAIKFIKQLGLQYQLGFIDSSDPFLSGKACLVIGSNPHDSQDCSVDLLLPFFPWIKNAVERAQMNLIDYGFAKLPTITPEDLLIAKSYALSIEPNRYQDLDDIKSILSSIDNIDQLYLDLELERLKIKVPVF